MCVQSHGTAYVRRRLISKQNIEQAAAALKLTAEDMLKNKLVDGIIEEPVGGAHTDPDKIFRTVKKEILKELAVLDLFSAEERIENRIEKYCNMGVVKS